MLCRNTKQHLKEAYLKVAHLCTTTSYFHRGLNSNISSSSVVWKEFKIYCYYYYEWSPNISLVLCYQQTSCNPGPGSKSNLQFEHSIAPHLSHNICICIVNFEFKNKFAKKMGYTISILCISISILYYFVWYLRLTGQFISASPNSQHNSIALTGFSFCTFCTW